MAAISKYVINLEGRTDRRAEMEQQLRRVGWQAAFFPAIRPADAADFPSVGARGCFLSHLATLKLAGGGHVLLMEDDLNFVADFARLWDQVFGELETKEWSIFYPGHALSGEPAGLSRIEPTKPVLCAHFLLIHEAALATLIGGLETILSRPAGHPRGGPMHVDGAYTTIRAQHPDLNTFVFSPSLGFQRSSRSDIAAPKFFDRIELLRPAMRRLRRLKQGRW